ncbi:hypothetical protein Tco_0250082, partial [Tanacetum coccineum]
HPNVTIPLLPDFGGCYKGFEVNLRDVFVNPAPNNVRDWVERCDLHVRKKKELRDRKTHTDLRQDLMEHLWNNDDE